jgi:hypothetical protein
MAKEDAVNISKADLQDLLAGILAKANQLNPLEARKYKEEIDKEGTVCRSYVSRFVNAH